MHSNKPCILKILAGDSFALKDSYEKILLYILGFPDFACMKEIPSNTNFV